MEPIAYIFQYIEFPMYYSMYCIIRYKQQCIGFFLPKGLVVQLIFTIISSYIKGLL